MIFPRMLFGSKPGRVGWLPNFYRLMKLGTYRVDMPPGPRLRQSTHYPPGKDIENSAVLPQNTWKGASRVGESNLFAC